MFTSNKIEKLDNGEKKVSYIIGKTKSGKSRIVDIPSFLIIILDKYINESNINTAIKNGRNKTGFVFFNEQGERQSPNGMRGRFTNLVKKHKLHDIGFGFHKYRHLFCTRLIEAGADVKYVMEVAGHTDIAITYKYYVKVTDALRDKHRSIIEGWNR